MRTLPWVCVLVEMRAVEIGKTMPVPWKMRWCPIEENPKVRLVAAVNKLHEVGRPTKAPGRREISERLIAPRAVIGVFHDREKLDVRITKPLDVRDQLISELAVGEPAVAFLRHPLPGTQMNLVDADWFFEPVFLRPLRHPLRVVPGVVVQTSDDRSRVRPQFRSKGVRIRFQGQDSSVRSCDLKFVNRPFTQFRNEQLPDSGPPAVTHRICSTVPAVKIAHRAHAAGARCPDR